MKRFKGTAICQFNVDVVVDAESFEKATEKMSALLDENLNDDFRLKGNNGYVFDINFDECFEILDIMEVKRK